MTCDSSILVSSFAMTYSLIISGILFYWTSLEGIIWLKWSKMISPPKIVCAWVDVFALLIIGPSSWSDWRWILLMLSKDREEFDISCVKSTWTKGKSTTACGIVNPMQSERDWPMLVLKYLQQNQTILAKMGKCSKPHVKTCLSQDSEMKAQDISSFSRLYTGL